MVVKLGWADLSGFGLPTTGSPLQSAGEFFCEGLCPWINDPLISSLLWQTLSQKTGASWVKE